MDPTKDAQSPTAANDSPAPDQRIADLELFVKGVVHDLNNSLNVIKTNLYLLRQRLAGGDAKMVRPLERIDDQVTAIRRLLEGHQAFYHAEQPVMQRVNLNDVARGVADSAAVPEGYDLQLALDPALPYVSADPRLLDAVLRALLRNSVRAMAGSGMIRMSTGADSSHVEIAVEDSGPGIPESLLPRAREPFVSGWPEHAGLGLALADRVAHAHGGELTIESKPGEGTRVAVWLPTTA